MEVDDTADDVRQQEVILDLLDHNVNADDEQPYVSYSARTGRLLEDRDGYGRHCRQNGPTTGTIKEPGNQREGRSVAEAYQ
jgi:hypothetical protein